MIAQGSAAASEPPATFGALAQAVLQHQHSLLLTYAECVLGGGGTEDLHALRVAVRRLRTAARLFAPVAPRGYRTLRRETAWLARSLAEARDRDVLDAQLQAWQAEAPPEDQPAFRALVSALEQDRTRVRRRMLAMLASSRYRRLTATIAEILAAWSPAASSAAPADVVPALLGAAWQKVRKAGDRLAPSSDTGEFHEVRLHNKRLRDASQFFAHLYGGAIESFLYQTDALHDALGAHQDATVAIAMLRRLRKQESSGTEVASLFRVLKDRYSSRRREAGVHALDIYREMRETAGSRLRDVISKTQLGGCAVDIYLIRHAPAFAPDPAVWPDDAARPLTPKGRRRWRRAARGLKALACNVDLLLASPLSRAWETAKLLHREGGWPAPERCDALAEQGSLQDVVGLLRSRDGSGAVALVGHEPSLHQLTSYLLTGDAAKVQLQFKKGACARLTCAQELEPGSANLRWVLMPRALRALAR